MAEAGLGTSFPVCSAAVQPLCAVKAVAACSFVNDRQQIAMSHLCALKVHQLASPFAKLLSYIWFYFRSAVKCTYSLYVLGLRGRNSVLPLLRTARLSAI